MSKTQNPITGRMSGKMGNARFSTWNGVNVVASMPLEVANPRTPKQTNARNSFALATGLGKVLQVAGRIGFKDYTQKQSPYNELVRRIRNNVVSVDQAGVLSVALDQLEVSAGPAENIENLAEGTNTATQVNLTWDDSTQTIEASAADMVVVAVISYLDADTYEARVETGFTRVDQSAAITVPNGFLATGRDCYAYVFTDLESTGQVSSTKALQLSNV